VWAHADQVTSSGRRWDPENVGIRVYTTAYIRAFGHAAMTFTAKLS